MSSDEEGDIDMESGSEVESDMALKDEADDDNDTDQEELSGIRQFSTGPKASPGNDKRRGEAVRQQLGVWDGLLETRIKLQKPLCGSNSVPRRGVFEKFKKKTGDAGKQDIVDVQSGLESLLKELVDLQDTLALPNRSFSLYTSNVSNDDDDEEIPSDDGADESHYGTKQSFPSEMSLEAVESFLELRHQKLRKYRDSTLESWSSKTQQFFIGKKGGFAAFDQSPVTQIEQIVADSERLVARTRIKRSTYALLGNDGASVRETQTADHPKKVSTDAEIFDDDDFYHQLLRELIERKTSTTSDPLELTRQQVQLAQLRKRTKKVVDSKATRDRKIKLDPHPKLVNFMAPKICCSITEQARNDLYKSLFGKLQRGVPSVNEAESIRLLNFGTSVFKEPLAVTLKRTY